MRLTLLAAAAAMLAAGCAAPHRSAPLAPRQIDVPPIEHPAGETPEWWYLSGAATAHNNGAGRASAQKVVLFVGDGMSLTTVAAARILEGQRRGQAGEENRLSFERFPHTALSKTYNTDQQTPDSAGTMTAMMAGVKTRAGVIGIDQTSPRAACEASRAAARLSVLQLAKIAGLGTGVVTTTRITHATPAATYGHSPDRNWEYDLAIPQAAREAGCTDLAAQLVEFPFGDGIDVVMGGGRLAMLPAEVADPEYGIPGRRGDGRNLVAEWQARHPDGAWLWNRAQFDATDFARTPKVLALFQPDHMRYEHERADDRAGEPSLAEMTRAAITALDARHPEGWFLMVEGGRIDHANHAGNAFRALTETIALSDAVRTAREMTSEDETLILVTADHGHVLSFGGYPVRGNPILGKVIRNMAGEDALPAPARDALGRPYTTLSYANGPGYAGANDLQPEGAKRYVGDREPREWRPADAGADLTGVDTEAPDFVQPALFPLGSETHSGDDVGLYASGPGAEAVRGVVEQNVIHHFIVQSQPALRRTLCELGACDADGVPVRLPDHAAALRKAAARDAD
ncbi:alkaline phosphatase [Coralloluteibacterium thermophilus]|uniref:Alkaline phosphatase n=1 Tax=Coralloluteibacterium thermophilum TaxID=2707049 RepID=A0ABV9NJY3_9GAMM